MHQKEKSKVGEKENKTKRVYFYALGLHAKKKPKHFKLQQNQIDNSREYTNIYNDKQISYTSAYMSIWSKKSWFGFLTDLYFDPLLDITTNLLQEAL